MQSQPQQQPSGLFAGKSGLSSPDATAATSPRTSAATTPVTMFGDTLLHHRVTKQVGSSVFISAHLLGRPLVLDFEWFFNKIISLYIFGHLNTFKNISCMSIYMFITLMERFFIFRL
jgi:hypothetical protein